MSNPNLLESLLQPLAHRISELAATTPARDIEKNVRALMTSTFARLDLVTREEFEIQTVLLARCQERLAVLEARLEKDKAGTDGRSA